MTMNANSPAQIIEWATTDGVLDAPVDGVGLCAAIGNFDGVHRGHRRVIDTAVQAARKAGLTPAIITFDPHPREYFRQDDAPFHLVDRLEKDRLLSGLDVARIIYVTFDDDLRRTDAEHFVTTILPQLGVKQLFAGADFAFGKGRGGDISMINELGANVGITAHPVPLLLDENSVVISSSRIRAAVQAGDPQQASEMLGHDWAVTGIVQQGDHRGRTIGFPTANIPLDSLQHPAFGVYAVQVFEEVAGNPQQLLGNGVANIGIRPTVENRGVLCEAHLFDKEIDLYGRRLSVRLKAFLRPEQRFSGIDELTAQIASDARDARALLPSLKDTA